MFLSAEVPLQNFETPLVNFETPFLLSDKKTEKRDTGTRGGNTSKMAPDQPAGSPHVNE
jgi:hypothetical protein